MLKPAFDQDSVDAYVRAVRDVLDRDDLRDAAKAQLEAAKRSAASVLPGEQPATTKLQQALPPPGPANQSSGGTADEAVPYLSRSPVVSLVQSALEEKLLERGLGTGAESTLSRVWHYVVAEVRALLHLDPSGGPFSPTDPEWVLQIALATLGHLAKGNHPFNPAPATHEITDAARLVVVGDWGTGLPRAQAVGRLMAGEVGAGLAEGRDVHVVHLGDVYYSGLPEENRRHVLDVWPVTSAQAGRGVTSWSLNGNHDMYSGGYGYYQTLLADPRFVAQASPDGRSTSIFRLTSPSWELLGLDTSWSTDVLSSGAVGVLQAPQADLVAQVAAASSRKMVLFSHHQLVSVYDRGDIGPELTDRLAPVLDAGRVTGWWWGHEHRSMGFKPTRGVQFPRCIGHGGVPVLQPRSPSDPVPEPGLWEDRGVLEIGGRHWARFGYAVLDLNGPHIDVRYVDETGEEVRRETVR